MKKKIQQQDKKSEDEFIEIDQEVWARFKNNKGE